MAGIRVISVSLGGIVAVGAALVGCGASSGCPQDAYELGERCVAIAQAACGDAGCTADRDAGALPSETDAGRPPLACEGDCPPPCERDADCDDGDPCSGTEVCNVTTQACVRGTAMPDLTPCGPASECVVGRCRGVACGDGVRSRSEECDDGDAEDGDGCDADCTHSCATDADCVDADLCNGDERCDLESHACAPGSPLVCGDDGSACTVEACAASAGCTRHLVDADGDGHAPSALGPCGDDCDDADPRAYAGAEEACNGRDDDCDGAIDEVAPLWYADCDGDGLAAGGAVRRQACAIPAPPAGCTAGTIGTWTTTAPGDAATIDCWDADARVRPVGSVLAAWSTTGIAGRATSADFDYDCDGREEPRWTTTGVATSTACAPGAAGCIGASGWTEATVPACGVAAQHSVCELDLGLGACLRRTSLRTQSCR